jgi:hypothetical protein
MPYGYNNAEMHFVLVLSLERHRLLWLYLKTDRFFSKSLNILHLAPEHASQTLRNMIT